MSDKIRYPQFAEHLKRLQRESGIRKQVEIARKLGINHQTYSSYARGITFPPPEIIVKLRDIFRITFEELFRPYLMNQPAPDQEDIEIDKMCDRLKKYCKADGEFKEAVFYLVESIKPKTRAAESKSQRAGGGVRTG